MGVTRLNGSSNQATPLARIKAESRLKNAMEFHCQQVAALLSITPQGLSYDLVL